MKRLVTLLLAAAFATARAVEVGTTQEGVEAEVTAIEFEDPTDGVLPTGPGSCTGWAHEHHPGYVVVPAECLEGVKYIYMGDPWTWQQGDFAAEVAE